MNTENLNAPFMVCGICLQPLSRFLPMNDAGEFTGEVVSPTPTNPTVASATTLLTSPATDTMRRARSGGFAPL